MTYPAIIGLSGYAQSGKDTVAGILHDLYGYEQIAFADVLRSCLRALNPIVSYDHNYEDSRFIHLAEVLDKVGYETAKAKHPEYRRLLQAMGTEVGRNILGENIWVDAAFRNAPRGKLIVVSDVRFPNEFEAIHDRGGQVWRVSRPGVEAINRHPSETALDGYVFDHTLFNDTSIAGLADRVLDLMDWEA